MLARRYRQHGVELRTGATAVALAPRRVALADGSDVECDAVLLAVGAEPARELVRSDFDECGDVGGGPGHWTTAAADGVAAARRILGLDAATQTAAVLLVGSVRPPASARRRPERAAAVECEGSEESFTARYFNRDGRLVAALAANRSADIVGFRRELACAA